MPSQPRTMKNWPAAGWMGRLPDRPSSCRRYRVTSGSFSTTTADSHALRRHLAISSLARSTSFAGGLCRIRHPVAPALLIRQQHPAGGVDHPAVAPAPGSGQCPRPCRPGRRSRGSGRRSESSGGADALRLHAGGAADHRAHRAE